MMIRKGCYRWLLAALLVSATTAAVDKVITAKTAGVVQRLMKDARLKVHGDEEDAKLVPSLMAQDSASIAVTTGLRQGQRELQVQEDNEEDDPACDAAFLNCLGFDKCVACYTELRTKEIDWASVTPGTVCNPEVLNILYAGDHCTSLRDDSAAAEQFCQTYQVCIRWEQIRPSGGGDGADGKDSDGGKALDCSSLKECKWDGIHEQFLGDGICHEAVEGCYNSAICGYDGGDCCEDTCKERPGSYVSCGSEPYACRAPNSKFCDPSLNVNCDDLTPDNGGGNVTPCAEDQSPYRLVMYDSFGDGWDQTSLKLTQKLPTPSSDEAIFYGKMDDGFQDHVDLCLSRNPACYHVEVNGGIWGKEVSWEVKPGYNNAAAPPIAGGGAPMSCDFSVAGYDADACPNTCTGRPNVNPTDDPEYKEFKELTMCIHDSCPIQVGICENDSVCTGCFQDTPQEYCFGIDAFNNLVDCTLCQCTENKGSDFCQQKLNPGVIPVTPTDNQDQQGHSGGETPCSPAQVVQGGDAVIKFGQCTEFDQIGMMVTEFDQNNFGDLDKFESCAHNYRTRKDHGGETALGCLRILVDAMAMANKNPADYPNTPIQAIGALATKLYHEAEPFCKCAEGANKDCPLCPSFHHFKTLLFETLDACTSLDEIDCDAWAEFYPSCFEKFQSKFTSTTFSPNAATAKDQCNFVHEEKCGGEEPFPVFRKLDCGAEISAPAWSFYQDYSKTCLNTTIAPTPAAPTPAAPTPDAVPTPEAPKPTPKPYVPPDQMQDDDFVEPKPYTPPDEKKDVKPYVPPEERGKTSPAAAPSSSEPKKKRHRLRNLFWLLVLGVGGYYVYQRRCADSFSFNRYRRMMSLRGRGGGFNFFGGGGPGSSMMSDDGGMYSGLAMDGSTTFEPPSLPPPPSQSFT